MSLQALRPLASGLDSPDAFPCLALRNLHFADSFAWRLCIHTNGKFAIAI